MHCIDHSRCKQEAEEWLLQSEIKNGKKSKPLTDNGGIKVLVT